MMTHAMTSAATLSATLLAPKAISHDHFFKATDLLATRFNRRSAQGDLRSDPEAPRLLLDWFMHAEARVPDFRVWDLTCQIIEFFDPVFGLYLPREWPWDTRDRVLDLASELRSQSAWHGAFQRAAMAPDAHSVRAVACCATEIIGVDSYPAVWSYLSAHSDNSFIWHLATRFIDDARLPDFLDLARVTLLTERGTLTPLIASAPKATDARMRQPRHIWHEVLRLLEEFPGEGIELIEAALRSNDALLKIFACDTLFLWPVETVPQDTLTLIRELVPKEMNEVALKKLERVVSGE